MTCVSKPAPQKTKIAQKLSTVGCRAVLPELIFVQARQSPQRILDVFARVLTRHERKPAGQNRHGFKSRQPMCSDGIARRLCWAEPVKIGSGCWICANVVILPGVTIGDNCVIGAGSVVTKSIPDNSVAVGNPCRVLRTLSEKDSLKYRPDILGDCSVID